MFLGAFRHQVDSKGRIAVPAAFRRELPEGSVVAFGTEARLVIYPPHEWEALLQRYRRTSETPAEERTLMRGLFGGARPLELDTQGRLLLAQEHRSFAGIGERAVFTGLGNVVEISAEAAWDAESASLTPQRYTELHDQVNQRAAALTPGA